MKNRDAGRCYSWLFIWKFTKHLICM